MKKLQKNWLEWIVFAVGLVLVLVTIGYLIYDAATLGQQPPTIEVKLGAVEQSSHSYLIPVSVINHGDRTAEGIQVEVVLESGGRELERAEFVVAFLPRKGTREGWVAFSINPSSAEKINARVVGYEKP